MKRPARRKGDILRFRPSAQIADDAQPKTLSVPFSPVLSAHPRLPRNAVGQILDGLDVLAEQWEATAASLAGGQLPEGDVLIRECGDAREAARNSRADLGGPATAAYHALRSPMRRCDDAAAPSRHS